MTSSSREAPVIQAISELTVGDGSKLFAGTANNTTNNIYNGWYTIPNIEMALSLNLRSGSINLQVCATKAKQGISVLDTTSCFFLTSENSRRTNTLVLRSS